MTMVGHILTDQEIQQQRTAYMSDNTAYMKWATEIETKRALIDESFFERNRLGIIAIDKTLPMGNFVEPRQKQLFSLKRLNLVLEINAGLIDSAEQTVTSMLGDIQMSRCDNGFFQKALFTQRQELQQEDKTQVERKRGILSGILGGKKEQPPQQGGPQQ